MSSPSRTAASRLLGECHIRLARAMSLEEIQAVVRQSARALLKAEGATFILREQDTCYYADEDALSPLWKGQRFPLTNCISGWAMLHSDVAAVPDITKDDRVPYEAYRPTFVKSLLMVPIGIGEPVAAIGVYWSRLHAATPSEIHLIEQLAHATATALERIGHTQSVVLISEHLLPDPPIVVDGLAPVERTMGDSELRSLQERVARDLHDTVLQRLFGSGMMLQGLHDKLGSGREQQVLEEVMTHIEIAARELRGVIFGLEYGNLELTGLPGEVLVIVAEASRILQFRPRVHFEGSFDHISPELRGEGMRVLREMLSNVARHAHATAVSITCTSSSDLSISVHDNGTGIPQSHAKGNGLRNLAARASQHDGTFVIGPHPDGGTRATWSVPLASL